MPYYPATPMNASSVSDIAQCAGFFMLQHFKKLTFLSSGIKDDYYPNAMAGLKEPFAITTVYRRQNPLNF
jgi:hypothetical protein